MARRLWWERVGVGVMLCVSATLGLSAAQPVADEHRLKAAIVLRVPQFVEWPAPALVHRATVDLCVLGPTSVGPALDELVQGERLGERALSVRQVTRNEAANCHVLFVPAATPGRAALLRDLGAAPVLTMSDAPDFIDDGGIMLLRVANRRVRFDISTTAADRAGLRLSAQLLRLAEHVHGGGR